MPRQRSITPQGHQPNPEAAALGTDLTDAKAVIAAEHARHKVRRCVDTLETAQRRRQEQDDPVTLEREQLVDLVLHLVHVAIHADRARQREILGEVQARLPTLGALKGALDPAPALPKNALAGRAVARRPAASPDGARGRRPGPGG